MSKDLIILFVFLFAMFRNVRGLVIKNRFAAATGLTILSSSCFAAQSEFQKKDIVAGNRKIVPPRMTTTSLFSTTTSCDAAMSNPLLDKKHTPLFAEIEPGHVLPALEHDLQALKDEFVEFEKVLKNPQLGSSWLTKRIEYDYAGVVESLEKIQDPVGYSWGVVNHLMGVKNSDEIRDAHSKMQPSIIKVFQEIGQSKPLFRGLNMLKNRKSEWDKLDGAQKRIIESALRQMENSGVGLEGEARGKFNKLQLEAAELSTKFSNNVLDSTKAFELKITNKDQISGLPESAVGLAAQTAVARGYEGATAESGPWVITLDMPSYLPAMKYLKDRSIREKLYRAFVSRASSGKHDNVPVVTRILQIKAEMANLLGYKCHAEKSLASKMAPNVDSVLELTEMLRQQAMPAAQQEMDELVNFARSKGCMDEIALWDVSFWSERLREEMYQYEEEELRDFFPLSSVLDGLFGLASRLFGITITPGDGDAQVWHKDVRYFHIKDNESGEHIASFFLDPYARSGEKRGGAWMDTCLGKSQVTSRKPVAYLVCNGSPPVGDKPSLMTFREVETLFHEFGHGLQHMLTKVEHGEAAGISNVEWDAVELPSQFMENWCYDKPTLYAFAKHYETGESLPDELFQKIKASKNFQAGLGMLRQLFFGALDMRLHSEKYDPFGKQTPFEVQQELAKTLTVIPPLAEDKFLCGFGHIFAGGYSAGYYSYKWAEVMSADAFGAFEEAGLDNEKAVQETGRRFRETVLSMGGGTHPSDVYKTFRGREPSPNALLRHSGLLKDEVSSG